VKSIGIDLGDTLNNLMDIWINYCNMEYNNNLSIFSTWNVSSCVKKECGNNIYKYLHYPGLFYNLEIKDNAASVVKWLYRRHLC
jgi:5'-nucleotidase